MKTLWIIPSSVSLLLLSVLFLQGCGGSSPIITRQLLSVTISPTTAAAPSSPTSQVQFVATGHYSTEPYTVTPLAATWGVQTSPQAIASTTQDGLATCTQGDSGTTTIEAWVQIVTNPLCEVIDSAGRPACGNVGGSAQLTCP